MSMAQCYIRNMAKLCLWESIIKGSEATCCWCKLESVRNSPTLSLEVGMNKLLSITNSGANLKKGEAFQWNQALSVKANTTLSLSSWRMCECVQESISTKFHMDFFFNAIVPSDHKSALIESLVPGTRLWNHHGQGLKAAEARPNVTYDTKKMVFKITSSKMNF